MDISQPMPGEQGEDEFDDAAQTIVDGIAQLIQLQQQQLQLLAMLAQHMALPKRIVRDANGRAMGVEPVSQ